MGIKVCKFGGTSLASAANIMQVGEIVRSDASRKFVVVSAPGKRFESDTKITDLLYQCARRARTDGTCAEVFQKVAERFIEITAQLNLTLDIRSILEETRAKIDALQSDDFAASRGEYLSARVMSSYLGYQFIDAEEVIKFDANGRFDSEYTNDLVQRRLSNVEYAVIPGFYGSKPGDDVQTFSRGGSDITGSIIARGVNAELYENWTDVCGFFSADPRLVAEPTPIKELTYNELRELSYMGASVLHADAIFPVKTCNIPINIRNTFIPEDGGTMIIPTERFKPDGKVVTGVAGKKNFTVITVEKSMMNSELGFARKVLSVLERYGISLEHMPSGIDTLSVVINSNALQNGLLDKVILRIREAVEPDNIYYIENVAIVATVGHGMCKAKGTSGRLFSALSRANVNVLMIDQGSSEMNIIVGVANSDYERTVRAIYDEFLKKDKIVSGSEPEDAE